MSRTWKKYPRSYFRRPRGRKQALIAGVRHGAVPPDEWDDIHLDKQCWLPQKVANGLAAKGWPDREIADEMMRRYRMPWDDVRWIVEMARYSRPKVPGGCIAVYEEKKHG